MPVRLPDIAFYADRRGQTRGTIIYAYVGEHLVERLDMAVGIDRGRNVGQVCAKWTDQEENRAELEATLEKKASEIIAGGRTKAIIRKASSLKPKLVTALWKNRAYRGKPGAMLGHPGIGKTAITTYMAAQTSNGNPWADSPDEYRDPYDVLMLTAEDDEEDTLTPRLIAAGADLDRVTFLRVEETDAGGKKYERCVNLKDIDPIRETIEAINKNGELALVIADPVGAMSPGVDGNSNNDVRSLFNPIIALGAKHNFHTLFVSHLSKAGSSIAMLRGLGSIGLVAACRTVTIACKDPKQDDGRRRLLLSCKNNVGPEAEGLAYTLQDDGKGGVYTEWLPGAVETTADEALDAMPTSGERAERSEAKEFLVDRLAAGDVAVKDIEAEAQALGISKRTLARARKDLGVVPRKDGNRGPWLLSLAGESDQANGAKDATESEECHSNEWQPSGSNGSLDPLDGYAYPGDTPPGGTNISTSGGA